VVKRGPFFLPFSLLFFILPPLGEVATAQRSEDGAVGGMKVVIILFLQQPFPSSPFGTIVPSGTPPKGRRINKKIRYSIYKREKIISTLTPALS
jgi:hypothetical protein